MLEHGIETGHIKRLPHGEFIEVHQPLGGVDEHGHAVPLAYQGAKVPKRMNDLGSAGQPLKGGWFRPDPAEEQDALTAGRTAATRCRSSPARTASSPAAPTPAARATSRSSPGSTHDTGRERHRRSRPVVVSLPHPRASPRPRWH